MAGFWLAPILEDSGDFEGKPKNCKSKNEKAYFFVVLLNKVLEIVFKSKTFQKQCTANVLSAEITDECLQTKSKDN